jgi:hypothetical protein
MWTRTRTRTWTLGASPLVSHCDGVSKTGSCVVSIVIDVSSVHRALPAVTATEEASSWLV